MIVLVGASASGKTELAKYLYKYHGYQKCITSTTREPRLNEIDGVDYHFLTQQTFSLLQSLDAFLEVTEYHGNLYGIQKTDVILNCVVIVDPTGANTLVDKLHDQAFVVYVETNEQTRKKRMIERGDFKKIVEERIEFDRKVFNSKLFRRINLTIKNENESLDELAIKIHQAYQDYLKQS